VRAGTSSVTIAPAATTAWSPIVTPGSTVAPRPIQTLRPMTTGAIRTGRPSSTSWKSVSVMVDRSAIRVWSPIVMLRAA
jgi:hypothetical protein